ncbi:MAG: threonine ammonia-lyase [Actinobacteria bacterium]|nr:threonine ammonia-lyase [Actinomycetota bacterium]
MAELVELDHIHAARRRLEGVIAQTPMEASRAVSEEVGARVLLKCEHLQRTGSFKLRGAFNRIVRLPTDERARGVVCASAGNHAQGVALSARLTDVEARVFMPAGAPLPKVAATRGYGATVELVDGGVTDALDAATTHAQRSGAVFVHPFEHADIIAGQGTLGLDILDDVPDAATIVVPIGGGGLISGIAAAVKAVRPEVRIVGVQSEQAAAVPASLRAGHPVSVTVGDTIADGIAVSQPGELTLAHIEALVDDVVTVSDQSIARTVLTLAERAKQVVEPSGATGLAAVLEGAIAPLPEPVVALLCGGNVDPLLLARIIQSGLVSEGRYLDFRTRVQDQPGALSAVLELVATRGANVVGVEHHRIAPKLGLLEVELELALETRGPEHSDELVACLRDAGYPVER